MSKSNISDYVPSASWLERLKTIQPISGLDDLANRLHADSGANVPELPSSRWLKLAADGGN